MKKAKQKPIFSRVQDLLGEATQSPPGPERISVPGAAAVVPSTVAPEAGATLPSGLRPDAVQIFKPETQNFGPVAGPAPALTGAQQVVPPPPPPLEPPPGDVSLSEPEVQVLNEELDEVPTLVPSAIQVPAGLKTLTNSLNMTFVLIPAGSFLMGSPETETGRSSDEIQHEVTISQDLYVQATPVTQGHWQALMGYLPSRLLKTGLDLPLEGVNWNDCQEFIRKLLALQEGIYRLPTEAEWEYACRSGSPSALANGDLITLFCDLDPALDEIGWYCGNSNRSLQPVAQKRPNAWGLYDMHGNVAEWCQDWYGSYPETAQTDPAGPVSGPGRVVRGGSWFSSAKKCRCAARFYAPPHSRNRFPISGFRLVREVGPE